MVDNKRRVMKKMARRVPSGESRKEYFKGKKQIKTCAISGKKLHGVTHEEAKVRKQSKTQKRPSVPFGGVLSGEEREKVFIEAGKVLSGKDITDVDQKYRKYVEQAIKRAE